ncbi:MAG: methionyl-tRNA formyltransferase, partial [Candidatus Planktophila sp.]
MRLAVAATSSVAQPTLDALLESPHSLVRIFTTADKPSGRGQRLTQSGVASWADTHSIECVKVAQSSQMADRLGDIDCVVTIAFGILLPQEILDLPKHGFINLHFSLLPAWRGAAPVQRAIESGDELLGITVFKLDAGMDTGPIYTKASFPRDPNIRSSEALEHLSREGVALIFEALN